MAQMDKPRLSFWQIFNISFGFFGIQIAFALQNANVSRIFQTLGASIEALPVLWLAGPITGLLVQPIVGHFSDRTWGPLGRRRPYFLLGAILSTLALFVMPNSPYLWVAAVTLWILDASINISMEPFRAFVGDMLPSEQRTRGFAMQTIFIGTGAFLASLAPWTLTELFGVSAEAPAGVIPDAVKYSFYIGAVALFLAVGWTVVSSKEYSPEELKKFKEPPGLFRDERLEARAERGAGHYLRSGGGFLLAGLVASWAVHRFDAVATLYILTGGLAVLGALLLFHAGFKAASKTDNFLSHILTDLDAMPLVMRRLAVVQFFSWFGLFIMWVYATPAVTAHHYAALDPTSIAYNEGANWVGVLFAAYNVIAAAWAFVLPVIAKALNRRAAHAINLVLGGLALASFYVITDPAWLWVPMIGIGMAWASILTMPYAILSDSLPAAKMGVYMGIFNFFIVIPQIVVAGLMGPILAYVFDSQAIYAFILAGASFGVAAAALAFVPGRRKVAEAGTSEAVAPL